MRGSSPDLASMEDKYPQGLINLRGKAKPESQHFDVDWGSATNIAKTWSLLSFDTQWRFVKDTLNSIWIFETEWSSSGGSEVGYTWMGHFKST